MKTLAVSVAPRTVAAHGTVVVSVQVNDAGAQLALVTRYGIGLAQERQVVAPRQGMATVRLQVLAPAHCTGSFVARVYVTATGGGRALTRATTFTVGCPSADSLHPSHEQKAQRGTSK